MTRRYAVFSASDNAKVLAALHRGSVALEGEENILVFTEGETLVIEREIPVDPELTALADMEAQGLIETYYFEPLHDYKFDERTHIPTNRAARRASKARDKSWEKKRKKNGWP